MSRYYFHRRYEDRVIWDELGVDLPDLRSLHGGISIEAKQRWRDVFRSIQGQPDRLTVITDETGHIIMVLSS